MEEIQLQQINDFEIQNENPKQFFIKIPQNNQLIDIRKHPLFNEKYNELMENNQKLAWEQYLKDWRKAHLPYWTIIELNKAQELQKIITENLYSLYPINVNTIQQFQYTGLHIAAQQNYLEIAEILHQNQSNLNALSQSKKQPFHLACQRNHLQIAKFLCEHNCQLNTQDSDGNTPLHLASINGHCQIVEYLLSLKNIDLSIKNNQFLTPYDASSTAQVKDKFTQYGYINIQFSNENSSHIYTKSRIENTLLNNSKVDHIEKFLFKKQSIKNEVNLQQIFNEQQFSEVQQEIRKKQSSIEISQFDFSSNQEDSKVIGPRSFNYIKILGEGAYGKVYLARLKEKYRTKQLPEYYAIKIIDIEQIGKLKLMRYIQTERNVLLYNDHPFIVKLYFAFQARIQQKEKLLLVLQYCPGQDMARVLGIQAKFPENVAKMYLAEILCALERLHQNFIIYRDLKPENIVFDEEGHACLTDFGLCKEGIAMNRTNTFCGTINFMAPEIIFKKGHNKSVDWYHLGTLLYTMLVGFPPYFIVGAHKKVQFYNILHGVLVLPKSITNEAKSLIIQLLDRNPNKRLGNINDAEDIKNHEFFKDIDWTEVMNRKLPVPKASLNLIVIQNDDDNIIQMEEIFENKIENWDFKQ